MVLKYHLLENEVLEKWNIRRWRDLQRRNFSRSKESFKLDEDTCSGRDDEKGILTEWIQDYVEKLRESNEPPGQPSSKQWIKENCKSNNTGKKK